jgi:hypothetical protein
MSYMTRAERIRQDIFRLRTLADAAMELAHANDFHAADRLLRESKEHLVEAIQLWADVVDEKGTLEERV